MKSQNNAFLLGATWSVICAYGDGQTGKGLRSACQSDSCKAWVYNNSNFYQNQTPRPMCNASFWGQPYFKQQKPPKSPDKSPIVAATIDEPSISRKSPRRYSRKAHFEAVEEAKAKEMQDLMDKLSETAGNSENLQAALATLQPSVAKTVALAMEHARLHGESSEVARTNKALLAAQSQRAKLVKSLEDAIKSVDNARTELVEKQKEIKQLEEALSAVRIKAAEAALSAGVPVPSPSEDPEGLKANVTNLRKALVEAEAALSASESKPHSPPSKIGSNSTKTVILEISIQAVPISCDTVIAVPMDVSSAATKRQFETPLSSTADVEHHLQLALPQLDVAREDPLAKATKHKEYESPGGVFMKLELVNDIQFSDGEVQVVDGRNVQPTGGGRPRTVDTKSIGGGGPQTAGVQPTGGGGPQTAAEIALMVEPIPLKSRTLTTPFLMLIQLNAEQLLLSRQRLNQKSKDLQRCPTMHVVNASIALEGESRANILRCLFLNLSSMGVRIDSIVVGFLREVNNDFDLIGIAETEVASAQFKGVRSFLKDLCFNASFTAAQRTEKGGWSVGAAMLSVVHVDATPWPEDELKEFADVLTRRWTALYLRLRGENVAAIEISFARFRRIVRSKFNSFVLNSSFYSSYRHAVFIVR